MTRTTMFVAVFAVAMMIGPGLMVGIQNLSPADGASAVSTGRVLRMGWPDFYASVATLNPHTMTMGQEYMLILPCYSTLLTYDENGQVMGDLATKWTVSPDGKDWHFWIVHSASFYDKNNPGTQVPLTTEDVIFSFWLTQNNTASIMNYYLPDDPDTGQPMILSMDKISNFEMVFHLRMSFSPFQSALVGVPIVPKYIWDGRPIGWANFANGVAPCIGSGPYYYAYDDRATIGSIGQSSNIMNPTWFWIKEYRYQPRVYEFRVKSETEASGISNFNAGNLDVLISPTPSQYASVSAGGPTNIQKFSSSQGFVLDMCINQLSDANRVFYGIGGPGDYNSQILLDPAVKYALRACVDRTSIVANSLHGGGSVSDSLMPSTSPWYYHYGSDPVKDTKLIPDSGDIPAGRLALYNAGWKYRSVAPYSEIKVGDPDYWTYHPLAKVGGTSILSFRYSYCDWYDFIVDEGIRIQGWAQQVGIDLVGGPATSSQMNSAWYTADYDVYLWDWWFSPNSEPSLDVMGILTTKEIISRGTDVNDANATYDALYYASLSATTFEARKAILDDMQRWAYENSGYWATAYRDNLYLAQTVGPNNWGNWGDWVAHYVQCPDSTYPWLFLRLNPGDNPAPKITSFTSSYTTDTTTNEPFTAVVSDNNVSGLLYNWSWGDGTWTGWVSSVDRSHTYAQDGYFTAHLAVKEAYGPGVGEPTDAYLTFGTAQVTVYNFTNALPVVQSWTPSPSNPTAGELVTFSGSATDADPRDTLTYSWNFGDGTTAAGQIVTHRFLAGAGIYSVTLSVDDGHLGSVPRPATRTQSLQVIANAPPIVSVGDYPSVSRARPYTFSVTASDSNPRDVLKYTWVWGDGEVSVTTTKSTRHTYKFTGSYTLTVWADDQTGLTNPSHNVSDTGLVQVWPPFANNAPTMSTSGFTVLPNAAPWIAQLVTLSATPTDADGDILDVTFYFGDGTNSGVLTQSDPNTTVTATHRYMTVDSFFPYVTFTDQIASAVTKYSTDMVPSWYVTTHGSYFVRNLTQGWNFVSLPLIGFGYKASQLGLNPGDTVSRWNTATGSYTNHVVGVPTNDFNIDPSTGYWINVPSGTRTLYISGNVTTTTQSRSITVPSGGGWAIIGFASLNTTRRAADVPAMFSLPAGNLTTVSRWNTGTASYTSWQSVIPSQNNFLLVPGQAYWILIKASGTLSYAP